MRPGPLLRHTVGRADQDRLSASHLRLLITSFICNGVIPCLESVMLCTTCQLCRRSEGEVLQVVFLASQNLPFCDRISLNAIVHTPCYLPALQATRVPRVCDVAVKTRHRTTGSRHRAGQMRLHLPWLHRFTVTYDVSERTAAVPDCGISRSRGGFHPPVSCLVHRRPTR